MISVTTTPSIPSCLITASVITNSTVYDYVEADCHNVTSSTVYTNHKLNRIKVTYLFDKIHIMETIEITYFLHYLRSTHLYL